jgi:phage regulator Rha-like protein
MGFLRSAARRITRQGPDHIGRGVILSNIPTSSAQTRTMSTREIAELVEARHNDVIATVDRLFDKGLLRSSRETRRESTGGRPVDVYDLIERDTHLVISGYSDEHRARVIDRWQELEAGARKPIELSRMDILKLAMESEEAKLKAEAERDEAIRTKAMIGSKREATAMNTAARATREAERLREELGASQRHATVAAVERALKKTLDWVPLRRWCKSAGLSAVEVPDARFGTVKAWPAAAWKAVYGVDLSGMFGKSAG